MEKRGMALGVLLATAVLFAVPGANLLGAEETKASQPAAGTTQQAAEKTPQAEGSKAAAPAAGQKAPEPVKADKNKVSYIIGMSVGRNIKSLGADLNTDEIVRGLKDTLSGAKIAITDEEAQAQMTAFGAELQAKQAADAKKAADENKAKEAAYLQEHKKKEGVQTTPSGVQYKVLKEGNGKKPTPKDEVTVNYKGSLIDGKEFDSSYKRNEPATFPVSGVIPGWSEAIQMMKTGSKWEIVIPSSLAYGEQGVPEVIPPNSALVFEVELISIKPPAAKKAEPAKPAAKAKAKTAKKAAKPAAKAADEGAKSAN